MNVDKDLFMYDLVAVTIIRDEAPYMKEWLDYHLLAGVDHFLIYDNDSLDNLQEILTPYVDKKLVTLIPYPKIHRQLEAYNDAVRYFKFFCRRMTFIDVDEFIFPQDGKSISQVADEILDSTNATGLAVNLHTFGSNNFEDADFEKGVLERFTRRAVDDWTPLEGDIPSGNAAVKIIADPRRINFFSNPHVPNFFESCSCINEHGVEVTVNFSVPVTADKIVINYYATKSREEYVKKIHRHQTARFAKKNELVGFDANDKNEILDEGILIYRDNLRAEQIPESSDALKILASKKRISHSRMLKALVENLTPDFSKNNLKAYFENPKNRAAYFNDFIKLLRKAPPVFFEGKLETFLTCLTISSYLQKGYLDEVTGTLFEEASLNALCKTFSTKISIVELRLLIGELPRLLAMPYAAVNSLLVACGSIFPQWLQDFRANGDMRNFEELTYIMRMVQLIAAYRKLIKVEN